MAVFPRRVKHCVSVVAAVVLLASSVANATSQLETTPHFLQKEVGNTVVGSIFGTPIRVEGTQCNTDVVENANSEQLHSILQDLAEMTYFRLIRVNLQGKCAWDSEGDTDHEQPDAGDASLESEDESEDEGSCGEEIEDDNGETEPACALKGVMESPFESFMSAVGTSSAGPFSSSADSLSFPLNEFLSEREAQVVQAASESENEQQCSENMPEFWLDLCSDFEATTTYNLQLNPERWTGYNGSAVWQAVYENNCFHQDWDGEQCYEEKVMFRLLSGMHASINIHISKYFYPPSKRKGRVDWTPNPARFMEQYGQNPEQHLKNLHFAFLVLLRAVQKASNYLYYHDYRIAGMDWAKLEVAESAVEEIKTQQLMRRLLDSNILSSCSQVFSAFDEKLLFRQYGGHSKHKTLKRSMKEVFSNISSTLNCVTCHKCRLHGKIQLMGLGAALKILLVPESYIEAALTRDDLIALVNTLAKFSSAITYAKELATEFWEQVAAEERLADSDNLEKLRIFQAREANESASVEARLSASPNSNGLDALSVGPLSTEDAFLVGLNSVATLASDSQLSERDEDILVDQLMDGDAGSLALAMTFARRGMHANFARHVLRRFASQKECIGCLGSGAVAPSTIAASQSATDVDVVVVGGGLAGLTAALTIADAGFSVALLEKQGLLGGNSAWASSGVNGVDVTKVPEDSIEAFTEDVVRSSQREVTELVETLTREATDGLHFLRDRVKFNLSMVGQLGGHSFPRTHRPSEGLVGQEIIMAMQKIVKGMDDRIQLRFKSRVQRVVMTDGPNAHVAGVEYVSLAKGADPTETHTIKTNFVLVATGGYGNDHTEDSLLDLYRPDLSGLPTTNNQYSTGDGVKLARSVGASLTDMEKVQVHPTGFIDPKHPDKAMKTLCAEILRGVGAVLLNPNTGVRFVDELGTRDHITSEMMKTVPENPRSIIVLNAKSAEIADKHVPLYTRKGLLRQFDSLEELAAAFELPYDNVLETVMDYLDIGTRVLSGEPGSPASDPFGKKYFHNLEGWTDPTAGPYYGGIVTPVVHYTMGGVTIDSSARVQGNESVVPGLYAAGEVVGGIHGENRLGGNALTEALVFGRVAAKSIIGELSEQGSRSTVAAVSTSEASASTATPHRRITMEELAARGAEECWVLIDKTIYDFKEFLDEHPAGPEAIAELAGSDGTDEFGSVHTPQVLDDFDDVIVGILHEDDAN